MSILWVYVLILWVVAFVIGVSGDARKRKFGHVSRWWWAAWIVPMTLAVGLWGGQLVWWDHQDTVDRHHWVSRCHAHHGVVRYDNHCVVPSTRDLIPHY